MFKYVIRTECFDGYKAEYKFNTLSIAMATLDKLSDDLKDNYLIKLDMTVEYKEVNHE